MKRKDVEDLLAQGHREFLVKVSGKVVVVRIDEESPYGGWIGKNKETGRRIRIKTSAKLRSSLASGRWL